MEVPASRIVRIVGATALGLVSVSLIPRSRKLTRLERIVRESALAADYRVVFSKVGFRSGVRPRLRRRNKQLGEAEAIAAAVL